MIDNAFTCSGAYAVLIMSGLKRVENRSCMPVPTRGRCAMSVSKTFCRRGYEDLARWLVGHSDSSIFKHLLKCEGYANWWILSNIRRLPFSIPCRGNVGMWKIAFQRPDEI